MLNKFVGLAAVGLLAVGLSACGTSTTQVGSANPSVLSQGAYTSAAGSTYGASAYLSTTPSVVSGTTTVPSALSSAYGTTSGTSTAYSSLPCSSTPGVVLSGTSGQTATSCQALSSSQAATDSAAVGGATGFSASITATQTTGLFTTTVTGVTVQVTNNDPTEESHFVIVSFTLNNNEVAVAYHRVDLTPGAQETLTFPVPTNASGTQITADNAYVEVKDSLL